MSEHALALDVGGTFTDVILVGKDGGLWTAKASSVPSDPSRGFFDGVDKILGQSAVPGSSVTRLLHGSTVATNAILEGRSARTGMLVTEGFKYILEIGRAEVPRAANLFAWVKPDRPVQPRMIAEVPERMLLDGSVERPLDEEACRAAVRRLKALGVESVAVVFLHSYANPEHERRAAGILREAMPEVDISLSSDVLPVFREYERSMATALNAGVQPVVGRYIGRLRRGMAERDLTAPFYVMKSNGGVFSPEQAEKQSIEMALSGPAAGAQGAAYVGALAGAKDIITIDIGGTSADVCLIRDGVPAITKDGEIGPFPLSIPIVDIHTIGAGGGSIASVTAQGALVVGPRSAGADPGPACYGKGGDEPTVTDANLLLGRVPPHLLDGEMALDPALAEKAIRTRVAEPLGIDTVAAAEGILAIVNNNMVGALKVVSVEKGLDPRDFTLCAFGGAGPMHGGDLARQFGTRRLLIPRHPGILCALGLLATDLQYDFARTRLQRPPNYDLEDMAAAYRVLRADAVAALDAEAVRLANRRLSRSADLRYARQGVEITVDFPGDSVDAAAVARLVDEFHALHERLYTFADRTAPVEIVNLRVTATGVMDKIELPEIGAVAEGTPAPAAGERRAHLGGGFATVPVYRREELLAGHVVVGPAIVDQLDTTTVILAGQSAVTDRYGSLSITDTEA
ncbi:MAG: hydantoinase/oxoprolinase family protein [Alphaproteobacteria bacterium]|nr:hydantoinase/oxoprolinase family protein [Alphaproteobacteria bacterium]